MKRYLLVFLIVCFLSVGVHASNLALDFQNPDSFSDEVIIIAEGSAGGKYGDWIQMEDTSLWGGERIGESLIRLGYGYTPATYISGIANADLFKMEYAAATFWGGCANIHVKVYDAGGIEMHDENHQCHNTHTSPRYEFKMQGMNGTIWEDGELVAWMGDIDQNPSRVEWYPVGIAYAPSTIYVDNLIYGSENPNLENSSDKYIFSSPADGYFIMKDFVYGANTGLYLVNQTDPNGTPDLIYSGRMYTSYSKGNGWNQTVSLEQWGGATYQQHYTGSNYSDVIEWDLEDFFDHDPPYGMYVTTIDGASSTSEIIPYIGSGASIQFDKTAYAVGETAYLSVELSTGYYDTDVYFYHVIIQDAFLNEVVDLPISISTSSPHTGTVAYTWEEGDDNGIYYGLIYATKLSDNEEIFMNYDTCELSGQLVIGGFVKDAETTSGILNATINITQGVITDSVSSGYDGNYTTTSLAFVSGAITTIFASSPGYENYTHVFTPDRAGLIEINLTLMPLNPTYYGIALGGIVRSPPYNRTVDSVTIQIQNASAPYGNYTVTTNSAGYYIKDYMPNNYWWSIWGNKTNYRNSSIYLKLVTGS